MMPLRLKPKSPNPIVVNVIVDVIDVGFREMFFRLVLLVHFKIILYRCSRLKATVSRYLS